MEHNRIKTPFSQRLQRARVGLLPFLVWLLCIWGAASLWAVGAPAGQHWGIAKASKQVVSMPASGAIESIDVALHEEVREGQILAVLAGEDLEAEVGTARAELQRLQAELEAQRATLLAREGAPTAGSTREGLRQSHQLDGASRLDEAARGQPLPQKTEPPVMQHDESLGEAQALASSADLESTIDVRLKGFRAALAVQERRLDQLSLRREKLLIRAPAAGTVSRVDVYKGQHLEVGQAVITIVSSSVDDVVVWVSQPSAGFPAPGDSFTINSGPDSGTRAAAECTVKSVAPRMEALPIRFWRDPKMPEYGRSFLLGSTSEFELIPGQLVAVNSMED